jgi:hypothetical protein
MLRRELSAFVTDVQLNQAAIVSFRSALQELLSLNTASTSDSESGPVNDVGDGIMADATSAAERERSRKFNSIIDLIQQQMEQVQLHSQKLFDAYLKSVDALENLAAAEESSNLDSESN